MKIVFFFFLFSFFFHFICYFSWSLLQFSSFLHFFLQLVSLFLTSIDCNTLRISNSSPGKNVRRDPANPTWDPTRDYGTSREASHLGSQLGSHQSHPGSHLKSRVGSKISHLWYQMGYPTFPGSIECRLLNWWDPAIPPLSLIHIWRCRRRG